jgi:hypothetical protein
VLWCLWWVSAGAHSELQIEGMCVCVHIYLDLIRNLVSSLKTLSYVTRWYYPNLWYTFSDADLLFLLLELLGSQLPLTVTWWKVGWGGKGFSWVFSYVPCSPSSFGFPKFSAHWNYLESFRSTDSWAYTKDSAWVGLLSPCPGISGVAQMLSQNYAFSSFIWQ